MTIGEKLLVFFLILVVVPLVFFALVFSQMMSKTTNKQFENSSNQFVIQAVVNIEKELEELDNVMLNFQWNQDIQKMLRRDYTNSTLRDRKLDMQNVINKMQIMTNTRLGIELFYLIRTDSEEYSIATSTEAEVLVDGFWNMRDLISEYAKKTDGQIKWVKLMKNDNIILGIRDVYDVEYMNKIGLLVIGIRGEQIAKSYSNLKTTSGSYFAIFDEKGDIISTDAKSETNFEEIYKSIKNGNGLDTIVNNYNYISKKSDYTSWTIVQATPYKEIMSSVNKTRYIIFGIILIALAIILFIVRIYTNSMVKPIKQLMGEMEKVKKEDFDVYADDCRGDEFGELAQDFNLMVKKIRILIEEDYKKKLILQDAEYKYLRAQINPHFIYNTLDSINWLAINVGQKEISRITIALGRLLRRSISGKQNVIRLGDELEGINDYITIQKLRYGERLNFEANVPADYISCVIPRSTLQPIIENALVHGLNNKSGSGRIEVSARHVENTLELIIKDDGIGMTSERINQVMEEDIEEDVEGHTGVGLKNVHNRIKLLFGEAYGIQLESIIDKGTIITIRVPLKLETDFNDGGI